MERAAEQGAVGGEVHAGGEDRVHEAAGVADEDHAGPPERRVGVGVVLAHSELPVLALGDPLGVAQVVADHRALGDEAR